MIGLKITLTPPGGSPTDYTKYMKNISIKWPASTDLPTASVTFNNKQDFGFMNFPLFGTMAVTLPNNLGTFNFYAEQIQPDATAMQGGGQNTGHTVTMQCTAAPELLYLTEGNLDVVGTDLIVGTWNQRGILYVPYISTFVPLLGIGLLDIGNGLTALLHNSQSNQLSGYRGRLGYDIDGKGVNNSTGIDFTQGVSTGWTSNGVYVDGMWQVGYGGTGAQVSGFDAIRGLCQNNAIDGLGNPQVLDFYVDPTQSPPKLTVFQRGSNNSGVGFTVGTDWTQDVHLPVDTSSVRNRIVYWPNAETVYPNSGDAWSNYDTTAHMTGQWISIQAPTGTGTFTTDTFTPFSVGFDNKYANSSTSANYTRVDEFNFGINGYRILNQPSNIGLASVSFYFYRTFDSASDTINVSFVDSNANTAAYSLTDISTIPLSGSGAWQKITIPVGSFTLHGGFSFSTSQIEAMEIGVVMGHNGTTPQNFWLDYIQLSDNWNFAPVYSFNTLGAGTTQLFSDAASGQAVLVVNSVAGFRPGQYVTIYPNDNPAGTNNEFLQISSIQTSNTTTVNANSASGQPVLDVASTTGFAVGDSVYINPPGGVAGSEVNTVLSIQAGVSLTMVNNLQFNYASPNPVYSLTPHITLTSNLANSHAAATPTKVTIATHDPNSVAAYNDRDYNFSDYYATNGGADQANAVAYNILNTRKGKSSSGTITVSGYASQLASIKPGYVFTITDPTDVYVGGANDSTIAGWIADEIDYNLTAIQGDNQGFTCTITVEPYYSSIGATSPDRKNNARDTFARNNRQPSKNLSRLNRMTTKFGGVNSLR